MKKLIAVLLCLTCFAVMFACNDTQKIKTYNGTPLLKLTYKTIDYNGGSQNEYVFDFEKNEISSSGYYIPYESVEPDFTTIATFSDAKEQTLINKLYTYGLFDLDEDYPSPKGIIDGGDWVLTIKYSNGTEKISRGSNNAPSAVFKECAYAFYDICQNGIVSNVP